MVIPVTRRIKLTQGEYALVDDADYEWLNQWKWYLSHYGYAVRSEYRGKKGSGYTGDIIYMHRVIMQTPKNMQTDHINHDKLDNRRKNLRVCDDRHNKFNAVLRKDNTSGYRGVRWHKQLKKWNARIYVNGKETSLGCYYSAEEAAQAYNRAATKYYGEFANLNKGVLVC